MPFARRIPVRHLLMLRLVLNIQTQTDGLAMKSREKHLRINQIGYNSTSSSIRFKRAKEFRYSGVMWFDFDTPAMSTQRRKTVGVQVFQVTEKNGTFASFFH